MVLLFCSFFNDLGFYLFVCKETYFLDKFQIILKKNLMNLCLIVSSQALQKFGRLEYLC